MVSSSVNFSLLIKPTNGSHVGSQVNPITEIRLVFFYSVGLLTSNNDSTSPIKPWNTLPTGALQSGVLFCNFTPLIENENKVTESQLLLCYIRQPGPVWNPGKASKTGPSIHHKHVCQNCPNKKRGVNNVQGAHGELSHLPAEDIGHKNNN